MIGRGRDIQAQIESATYRWDVWIEFAKPERLVVHPEDWKVMGYPLEYEGLPVKPLGVTIEQA